MDEPEADDLQILSFKKHPVVCIRYDIKKEMFVAFGWIVLFGFEVLFTLNALLAIFELNNSQLLLLTLKGYLSTIPMFLLLCLISWGLSMLRRWHKSQITTIEVQEFLKDQ